MSKKTSLGADISLFDIGVENAGLPHSRDVSKSLTAPDNLTTLLYSRASRLVSFPALKEYIYRYCLHELRKSLPEQEGYRNYLFYIDLIYSRLCNYVLYYPQKILVTKRIGHQASSALQAWLHWNKMSPWDKKKVCRHILVTQVSNPSECDFIDLRFFQSEADLEENQPDVDYEEDPYTSCSSFAPNRFFSQKITELPFSHHNLTLEELALICAGHIIEQTIQNRDVCVPFTDILPEIDSLVEARRLYKERRNTARLDKIVDGATLAVLLKRIRKGSVVPLSVLRRSAGSKRKRINNTEFSDVVYNAFLGSLFNAGDLQKFCEAPAAQQLLLLKAGLIKGLSNRRHYMCANQFQELFKNQYLPPFLIDSAGLFNRITNKVKSELILSEKEMNILTAKSTAKIKRLGKINPNDKTAMHHIAALRAKHLLAIQAQTIEQLLGDTFIPDLYLGLTDIGVTPARIRALFKGLYVRYLPERVDLDSPSEDAHDILLNHEKNLLRLASSWSRSLRFSQVINKIIGLLTSQLGGAQGDAKAAFENWSFLPSLAGKELRYLDKPLATLKDIVELSRYDPDLIVRIEAQLSTIQSGNVPISQLITYARNTVDMNSFHAYLAHVKTSKIALPTVKYPACPQPIQSHFNGLTLEVVPYDHLQGNLGAGLPGVCIAFNQRYHHQHRHPAAANFIVRSETHILLWGLLIRAQNKPECPTYVLNNLQGRLPSMYAKYKIELSLEIRLLLTRLGDVYTSDHYFNAINLVDPERHSIVNGPELLLPLMRLDLSLHPAEPPEGSTGEDYGIVESSLYCLPCQDADAALSLHGERKVISDTFTDDLQETDNFDGPGGLFGVFKSMFSSIID